MSWLPSSPYLPEQRLEVLDRRRLERLEPVALVDALDDADDVLAAPHVFRQEVAHAARRLSACHRAACYSRGSVKPCCFWYLPFLSAYETSHSSSLWKNSTCEMPSLA